MGFILNSQEFDSTDVEEYLNKYSKDVNQNEKINQQYIEGLKTKFKALKENYLNLKKKKSESDIKGGANPLDINMNATGVQAQNIGDYAGEMANKV